MLTAIKERIQDGERLLDPTRAKDTSVAEMISWVESFSAYVDLIDPLGEDLGGSFTSRGYDAQRYAGNLTKACSRAGP